VEAAKIKVNAGPIPSCTLPPGTTPTTAGQTWCTALGHAKEDYQDPPLRVTSGKASSSWPQRQKLDYTKAYATSRDEPVR
jgi:hypothetical protein